MKRVRTLVGIAPGAAARMSVASLVAAATEGIGVVLLVPLLGRLGGDGGALPAPLAGLSGLSLPLLLGLFVVLVTLRALVELLRSLAAVDLSAAVVDRLRTRALAAVLAGRWRYLAGLDLAQLRALMVSSLERTGHAALLLADGARTAAGLAALTGAGLLLAPWATLAALAAALPLFAFYRGLRRRAHALGEELSHAAAVLQRRLDETLAGLRLIKSHGREARAGEDVRAALGELRQAQRGYARTTGLARAGVQAAAAAALAFALWLALARWHWPLAVLLPLAALAVRAVPLLAGLQQAVQDWHHAAPALDEVEALVRDALEHAEPAAAPAVAGPRESIALAAVSLAHAPGRAALDGASLVLPVGSITALHGPSGAGKSTLADVLGGLLAPDAGALLVDGRPLAADALPGWRRRVAYVHQEPVLFTATLRENLAWAAPAASEGEMLAALERAGAGFAAKLPQGLDTPLGEGGRALSGGERQRIALARALLGAPDLLILDEATSALDAETERAITAAIAALEGQTTVLVIAHRGSLAQLADRSYRIDRGKVNGPLPRNSP